MSMKADGQHTAQNAMRFATGKGMVKTDEHCCSGIPPAHSFAATLQTA
jgi:hypothetical protein